MVPAPGMLPKLLILAPGAPGEGQRAFGPEGIRLEAPRTEEQGSDLLVTPFTIEQLHTTFCILNHPLSMPALTKFNGSNQTSQPRATHQAQGSTSSLRQETIRLIETGWLLDGGAWTHYRTKGSMGQNSIWLCFLCCLELGNPRRPRLKKKMMVAHVVQRNLEACELSCEPNCSQKPIQDFSRWTSEPATQNGQKQYQHITATTLDRVYV